MIFNKFLNTFIVACSVFASSCNAQVTIRFQENDKYSVRLLEEEQIFDGIKSFSQNLKNIASKYLTYTNIDIDNNNIIFNDFMFNKQTFSVIYEDKGVLGWFVLHNDCKSPKNIVLNYKDDEEVHLPRIILYDINSLSINSNYCDKPQSGVLDYKDLKKISFNKKPISIRNLEISVPGSDTLAVLEIYIRKMTNDYCNIF